MFFGVVTLPRRGTSPQRSTQVTLNLNFPAYMIIQTTKNVVNNPNSDTLVMPIEW